jgi:serine/threonine protein kinase
VNVNELDIFSAALELRSSEERARYLDQACGDNRELRRRIEELLASHAQAASFMNAPAHAAGSPSPAVTSADAPVELPGTLIAGKYKLVELIGEGGMGTVWMAQQTEPVKRLVALKLIKPGMDSRQVIARFEAERQALALMDHPNIAKVLDAGTVGQDSNPAASSDRIGILSHIGRPYFVMELVKGVPITKYCDEHRLTPRQRLELFVPVCHAVQHAHQKGIIHRDLKPSNVLVALYDDRPVPKVIDFGVAKATGQQLTEETLHTGFGAVVGTVEYMSPEQATLNQLDIDTRSDIYSLGVLLYELLTGSPPFSRKDLEQAGMLEMLRVIREQEPSKPSTKLSNLSKSGPLAPRVDVNSRSELTTLASIAANRGTEPAKLTRLVRGELDWIVMKALEKDRNRRYESANAFALDVQRYLAGEPVLAVPPSVGYRFRKFARRNKRVLGSAAAFVGLLITAVVLLAVQNRQLRAEQRRTAQEQARAEAHFQKARGVVDDMVSMAGSNLAFYPHMTALRRDLLEKALAFHQGFLDEAGDDPEVRRRAAEASHRMAAVYRELGQAELARTYYEESLARTRAALEQFPNDLACQRRLAGTLLTLGGVLVQEKQYGAARLVLEEALARCEQLVAELPEEAECQSDLAAALHNHAVLLEAEGRTAEAIPLVQRAIEHQRAGLERNPKSWENREFLGNHLQVLSRMLRVQGKHKQALDACLEAKAIREQLAAELRTAPGNRKALAGSWHELADLHYLSGNHAQAVEAVQKSYQFSRQLTRDFPAIPEFAHTHALSCAKLGAMLDMAGRKADALTLYQQGVKIAEPLTTAYPKQAENHSLLGGALNNVARLRADQKELTEARALYERAVQHQTIALQLDPKSEIAREYLGNHLHGLADTLTRLGEHVEAAKAASQLADLDRPPPPRRLALVNRAAYADRFWAAEYLGRCAVLAAKDENLAPDQRAALAEDYSGQAVERLRQAVQQGFKNVDLLRRDPDFESLRSREGFQRLIRELEDKKEVP